MWADVMDSMTSPESLLKSIVNIGYYGQLLFFLFKNQIIAFEKEKLQFYFKISSPGAEGGPVCKRCPQILTFDSCRGPLGGLKNLGC